MEIGSIEEMKEKEKNAILRLTSTKIKVIKRSKEQTPTSIITKNEEIKSILKLEKTKALKRILELLSNHFKLSLSDWKKYPNENFLRIPFILPTIFISIEEDIKKKYGNNLNKVNFVLNLINKGKIPISLYLLLNKLFQLPEDEYEVLTLFDYNNQMMCNSQIEIRRFFQLYSEKNDISQQINLHNTKLEKLNVPKEFISYCDPEELLK